MRRTERKREESGLFGEGGHPGREGRTGRGERRRKREKGSEMGRQRRRWRTEGPGSECAHRVASIPPPAFPACTHSCSCTAAVRGSAHARLRARLLLSRVNLAYVRVRTCVRVCMWVYKYIFVLCDAQQSRRRRAVLPRRRLLWPFLLVTPSPIITPDPGSSWTFDGQRPSRRRIVNS